LHRIAAIVFMGTVLWHCIFLIATRRGRQVFVDMLPRWADFVHFFQTIAYNLRMHSERPREGRFTYVEKAEYWALVWGTVVMIASGMVLWFDVGIARYVLLQVIDAALVFHFWEAWLATLAIAVWHFYSVLFDPEIYPMNPSWLDGTMPEWMHRHEHPENQVQVLDDNASLQGADQPAAMHERLIAADDDSEAVSRERPHGHAKSSDDDG
jgi:cytochrome b subunit of formate dehydrogenase